MTSQGSAYMRFRRALDRGNATEALSSASELEHVGLTEALELTLLLAEAGGDKYERAAVRWHVRFVETPRTLESEKARQYLLLRRFLRPVSPPPRSLSS